MCVGEGGLAVRPKSVRPWIQDTDGVALFQVTLCKKTCRIVYDDVALLAISDFFDSHRYGVVVVAHAWQPYLRATPPCPKMRYNVQNIAHSVLGVFS